MEMEIANEKKNMFLARGWKSLGSFVMKVKEKCVGTAKNAKKIAKDDPRRIIHSLKMALALTLVSLFYYIRPLYDGFGVSGMWAVLTVVVVFEFSVGKFQHVFVCVCVYIYVPVCVCFFDFLPQMCDLAC